MPKGLRFKTEDIAKALHATRGMMAKAAGGLGCSVETVEIRVKRVKSLKDIVTYYQELRLDKAITKLEEAIDQGKPWAIQTEIKYRGRSRGYVASQEITGADGLPVGRVPGPDVGNMADEQFREYLNGLAEAARRIASE